MNYIYVSSALCFSLMSTLAWYAAKKPTSTHLRYMLDGRRISAQVTTLSPVTFTISSWVISGLHRFVRYTISWSASLRNASPSRNITDTFKTVNHQLIQSSP